MLEVVAGQAPHKMMSVGNADSLAIGQVIAMAVAAVVVVEVKEDLIVVATAEEVIHREEVDRLVEVVVIVVIAEVEMMDALKNSERVFALYAERKVI
jgi:hypothetical protein